MSMATPPTRPVAKRASSPDVTVGSFVIAQGTLRADGSLDADSVHTGLLRFRDGDRPGRFFEGMPGMPDLPGFGEMPEATPTPSTNAS